MREYRIYHLDRSGRVIRRESVECPDDECALALLEPPAPGGVVELWDMGRLVAKLEG